MKIEEGRYYRTRDGRKVGPMKRAPQGVHSYEWTGDDPATSRYATRIYDRDGTHGNDTILNEPDDDLISEWSDTPSGPVRTVTRKEIVPGKYGRLIVSPGAASCSLGFDTEPHGYASLTAPELRSAAATLIEIADALEDK